MDDRLYLFRVPKHIQKSVIIGNVQLPILDAVLFRGRRGSLPGPLQLARDAVGRQDRAAAIVGEPARREAVTSGEVEGLTTAAAAVGFIGVGDDVGRQHAAQGGLLEARPVLVPVAADAVVPPGRVGLPG